MKRSNIMAHSIEFEGDCTIEVELVNGTSLVYAKDINEPYATDMACKVMTGGCIIAKSGSEKHLAYYPITQIAEIRVKGADNMFNRLHGIANTNKE